MHKTFVKGLKALELFPIEVVGSYNYCKPEIKR